MKVEDPEDPRLDTALDLFEEQGTIQFLNLYLDKRSGRLDVGVESSWSIANINHQRATEDLRRAHANIDAFEHSSPRFARAVRGLSRRFVLFHGYGMGSVEICEETPRGLRWIAAEPLGRSPRPRSPKD
jgi:hypothetical protein